MRVWGGNVANNDLKTATGSILSPALASLGFENQTGDPAWFIINPLPPGYAVGGTGAEESGVAPPLRPEPSGGESCAGSLQGVWAFTSNGYGGKIEISGTAGGYSARVFYALVGKWESLEQFTFDTGSCKVSFVRIVPKGEFASEKIVQTFAGTRKGNRLDGQSARKAGSTPGKPL